MTIGIGSDNMALSEATSANQESDTAEKNLDQFEKCDKDENCKWRDTNGRCIFETCLVENELPPATLLWYFECIACKEVDSIKPNDMKIHFCRNCITQLQTAQVLPFRCIICGSSQSNRGKGFGNQICDHCISRLSQYINQWHCESC